jgi:alginate O-acetyltransferase complex protein AlgI
MIDRASGPARRLFLILSIVANVGLLAAFKYFNFFNDNLHRLSLLLHWSYPVRNLGWLLPIGLSFHTFQSMAYTIEVYRGNFRAERHAGIYALYVLFYPQLVAGPIERPQHLLPQFRRRIDFDPDRIYSGLRLMLWGFFLKLVIADRMSAIVDTIYGNSHAWGGGWLLLATYCFAIQIYCDFAGYSDIAIGAARVLGFGLMTNFDRPYAARSVGEFWRRWHISLSTWFRDYLYIPLGGNRVGAGRWCFNILVVFVVSGLWHGASWTFAIWGLLHGCYLVASRLTRSSRAKVHAFLGLDRMPTLLAAWQIFVTFNLVSLAWIFFRAASFSEARSILKHLFQGHWLTHPEIPVGMRAPFTVDDLLLAAILVFLLEVIQWAQSRRRWVERFDAQPMWIRWPAYYAIIISILWIGELGQRSFIYFQF